MICATKSMRSMEREFSRTAVFQCRIAPRLRQPAAQSQAAMTVTISHCPSVRAQPAADTFFWCHRRTTAGVFGKYGVDDRLTRIPNGPNRAAIERHAEQAGRGALLQVRQEQLNQQCLGRAPGRRSRMLPPSAPHHSH
jgi:hypothetical protein